MKLTELKKQALKIDGDFQNHYFRTYAGGSPSNQVGIPEVSRSDDFVYEMHPNASAGEVVILCRKIGAKDSKERDIYITSEGITFVYSYYLGGPGELDQGNLVSPKFS